MEIFRRINGIIKHNCKVCDQGCKGYGIYRDTIQCTTSDAQVFVEVDEPLLFLFLNCCFCFHDDQ